MIERGTQLIQCGMRPQQYPRVRQQRSLELAERRTFGKRDELTIRGMLETQQKSGASLLQ